MFGDSIMANAQTLPDQPDDRTALRRFVAFADPEAFELITRRYQSMVLGTCTRILHSQSDAEDAAQETFLKLARHASQIRSNLGAWLHAAAMGCSIDLIRRANAQRQAEHRKAISQTESMLDPTHALSWSEIEPVLDKALASLESEDRELLVVRYLCTRSQRDIARELGLSEGTVSRRIQRSLDRLRAQFNTMGLRIENTTAMIAVLGAIPAIVVPTTIASAVSKLTLYHAAQRTVSSASLLTSSTSIKALTMLTLGAVIIIAIKLPASLGTSAINSGSALVPAMTIAADLGPARPTSKIGPFQTVSAGQTEFFERGVWFRSDNLVINHGIDPDSETIKSARLEILERTPTDEGLVLSARVREVLPLGDPYSRFKRAQQVEIRVTFDDVGRIVLEPLTKGVQLGANEPRWFGVRPPLGWDEHARIPDDSGPDGILGPWTEAERVPVTITAREIRFGTDSWQLAVYRIIDWDPREGYARVESIHAGGRDPTLISTRFKLLIRKDAAGYAIAYFPPAKGRASRWPSSFEFSADNPITVVTIKDVP